MGGGGGRDRMRGKREEGWEGEEEGESRRLLVRYSDCVYILYVYMCVV